MKSKRAASELLEVDPAFKFSNKLDELLRMGKIGSDERKNLAVLVSAGHAAAHRGWKPRPTELNTLMNIIETFLHRNFVLSSETKKLEERVPLRPKRREL